MSDQYQAATEAASAAAASAASAAKVSSLVTVGSGAVSVGGYAVDNGIATWLGAMAAVLGLLITWYYNNKRHSLEQERTEFERREDARKQAIHDLEIQMKRKALQDCTDGKGPCE